jgi:hypothetical protein
MKFTKLYLKGSFLLLLLLCGGVLSAQSLLENTQVRFFTDAGITAARDTSKVLTPAFQFGGIEILITSQITDKISLLAEPVMRPDGTISMERVMIKYSLNTYFNLSAGRLYTPIGLWNTTFFRYAKALTPTIDAPPIIANFEEGGTAINKDNGIQISGDDISKLRFGYRIMAGNGYNLPNSKNKIYYGNFFIEPIDNLRFALFTSHQKVVSASAVPAGTLNVGGTSLMYMGDTNFEFALDYSRAYFRLAATGSTSISNIYYVYVGYKINNIVPYIQYYNGLLNFVIENASTTIGLRYNISALSVLKAEAQFLETDDFAKINQVKVIWAIGF